MIYLSAFLVFINLYCGAGVIRIASMAGSDSISFRPFSAPSTLTAVAKASASRAFTPIIVTLERVWLPSPFFVSMIWLYLLPLTEMYLR